MTSRKSVVITGCSEGGIGHALALEFHKHGLRVIATARRAEAMARLAEEGIETLVLDVTNEDAVNRFKEDLERMTSGRLDVLVNNAGQSYTRATTDQEPARVRALFEVNLFAPMALTATLSPLLVAAGDARVVQIGSISGVMPYPFGGAYGASKAALHAWGNTLRVELAPFGVKVITVVTGGVKSNIGGPSSIPEGSLFRPMEDLYQQKRVQVSQRYAWPTAKYAAYVVRETLKPKPRAWVWAGHFAWQIWFLDTFFWRTIFDNIISRRFGISGLAQRLRARRKTD